jgi:AraC family transcriptional regulator
MSKVSDWFYLRKKGDLSTDVLDSMVLASPPGLWSDIDITQFSHSLQEFSSQPLPVLVIGINLGQPFIVTQKIDGRVNKQQQIPGTLAITPAGIPGQWSWAGQEQYDILNIHLKPMFLREMALKIDLDPDRIEIVPQLTQPDLLVHGIALSLKAELESGGLGGRLYVESATTVLAIHLLRHYCTQKPKIYECTGRFPEYRLRQAIDYIHDHLAEDVSLEAIAQHLGMSRYYFVRLFKQSMGTTPHQYVLQQRIERSKELLKQRRETIADIALACGFADQNHFSKQFRQLTGTTPKTFREGL